MNSSLLFASSPNLVYYQNLGICPAFSAARAFHRANFSLIRKNRLPNPPCNNAEWSFLIPLREFRAGSSPVVLSHRSFWCEECSATSQRTLHRKASWRTFSCLARWQKAVVCRSTWWWKTAVRRSCDKMKNKETSTNHSHGVRSVVTCSHFIYIQIICYCHCFVPCGTAWYEKLQCCW